MKIQTQTRQVVEFSLTGIRRHDDPYNTLDVDVIFTAPDGAKLRVPAFWAGGNVWRVRFAASQPGLYTFESVCSDPGDTGGLQGVSGTLEATLYDGDNPLLTHGRVRVASDARHFEHEDGAPFFWMGDTWWMGLSSRLDWPHGFREIAADRVKKGFNVVQIIAGPYPDMDAWDARGRNGAGHPFMPDFATINPDYYDEADLKIAHLVEAGLMPCIVGMWGYYLPQIGVEKIKRFWRNLIARYGAYPVVWCAAGEGTMPYYLSKTPEADRAAQQSGWTDIMRHIRATDPFRNLVTIHPSSASRDTVDDPSVLDFEMLQTGHGDMDSVAPTSESVRKAIARKPAMPVIDAEVNYEGILGYAWQNIQRLCFWIPVLNGAAGHTYGANGIWQMCTDEQPYGPSPHGRCWGNTPWSEAMHLPGSRQVGAGAQYVRKFRWWEWTRHSEWIQEDANPDNPKGSFAVGVPGEIRVIYCAGPCWTPPEIKALEPGVEYHAEYFDPVRGSVTPVGAVTRGENGAWSPPIPPECHDWILVLTRNG